MTLPFLTDIGRPEKRSARRERAPALHGKISQCVTVVLRAANLKYP